MRPTSPLARRPGYLGVHSAPVAPTVADRVVELRRKLVALADEVREVEQQIADAEVQAVLVDYAKTCRVVLRVAGKSPSPETAHMTDTVLDSLTRSATATLGMPLSTDEWCDALKRLTPADVDDVDGPMRAAFERVAVQSAPWPLVVKGHPSSAEHFFASVGAPSVAEQDAPAARDCEDPG